MGNGALPPAGEAVSAAAMRAAWIFLCLAMPLSVAGANIGWGLVLAVFAASAAAGEKIRWRTALSPLWRPLWAMFAAAVLSCFCGADWRHSVPFLRNDLHRVWLAALFSAGLSLLGEEKAAWTAPFWALCAGFSALACCGLFQSLLLRGPSGEWPRAHAGVHPVTFGEQTALGALGTFCFLLRPPDELRSPGVRRLTGLLLAALSAALILSQTRGALLGLLCGVVAVCLIDSGLRPALLKASVPAAAAIILSDLLPTGEGRSLSRWAWEHLVLGRTAETSQLHRLTLWRAGWRMFLDHPWTGVGLNNFPGQFPRYFSGIIDGGATFGTAHNLYLHHMAERGLAGLSALAFLLAVLWLRAARRAKEHPDAWNLWAFGATAAFTAMNLTEVALQIEQVWMLFFLIWIWAEVRHAP